MRIRDERADRRRIRVAATLVLAVALGCEAQDARRTFGEPRVVEEGAAELRWHATTGERFGFDPARRTADGLRWDTPSHWVELSPSSTRLASFRVAGREDTDCALTRLAGDGGGLAANVDRWRGQMGLGPLSADELQALPRATLLGREAVLLELEGTYAGMGAAEGAEGFALLGLLGVGRDGSVFLKLVAPADVVRAEREAFLALARSFRFGDEDGPAGDPAGGDLAWEAPAGWRRAPGHPLRLLSFVVGDDDRAECAVTVFPGDGGGAGPNVSRWQRQLGGEALSRAELDALPRIPMLGTEALVFEGAGTYEGMSGERIDDAYLLGAVCHLGDRTLFVKLVGPRATVEPARADFLAFCASLGTRR